MKQEVTQVQKVKQALRGRKEKVVKMDLSAVQEFRVPKETKAARDRGQKELRDLKETKEKKGQTDLKVNIEYYSNVL